MQGIDLPLFNKKGILCEWDADVLVHLPEPQRMLYQKVADCYSVVKQIDAELKTAQDHVQECAAIVTEAERIAKSRQSTFYDEWRRATGKKPLSHSAARRAAAE
jgi:hypothetical protein